MITPEPGNSQYDFLPEITGETFPSRTSLIGFPRNMPTPCGDLLYFAAIKGYQKGYINSDSPTVFDSIVKNNDLPQLQIHQMIEQNSTFSVRRGAYRALLDVAPDVRIWRAGSFSNQGIDYGLSLPYVLSYLFKGAEINMNRTDPALFGISLKQIVEDDGAWNNVLANHTLFGSGIFSFIDLKRYSPDIFKPKYSQSTSSDVLTEISKGDQLLYENLIKLLSDPSM